jgi:hypothetical protein
MLRTSSVVQIPGSQTVVLLLKIFMNPSMFGGGGSHLSSTLYPHWLHIQDFMPNFMHSMAACKSYKPYRHHITGEHHNHGISRKRLFSNTSGFVGLSEVL